MLKQHNNNTKGNLQINAGLLFHGFELSEYDSVEQLREQIDEVLQSGTGFLGATGGCVKFRAEPKFSSFNTDSQYFNDVNGTVLKGWDVELSAVLTEFTPELFNAILHNSFIDWQYDMQVNVYNEADPYQTHSSINLNDGVYENLVWFGDMSDGGLLVIEIKNAVSTGGVAFEANRDSENGFKVKFVPHIDGVVPFSIHWVKNKVKG
jgi:hypothetical protein